MKLRLISDYGADEHLVASEATPEVAKDTIQNLDWHRFHQVIAEKENGDWFEVGGSLHPSDGLSVTYEEGGKQSVIRVRPTGVEELVQYLVEYISGNEAWRKRAKWD